MRDIREATKDILVRFGKLSIRLTVFSVAVKGQKADVDY